METATQPQQTTKLGTPLSSKWDPEWVAEVERVERELDHRICGAHSPAYTPCKLGSTHHSGRCRYHGGHSNIGAPLGNRNAMIHGLYSRRLQQCGDHCALWETCPMPNKDLAALPPKERPRCPYEEQEYETVTRALQEADTPGDRLVPRSSEDGEDTETPRSQVELGNAPAEPLPAGGILLHHNIATLQIMLTRADAALGLHSNTEETRADGENYTMHSSKISALLQAKLSIARELRQWMRLLANNALRLALGLNEIDPEAPEKPQGGLGMYLKRLSEEMEEEAERAAEAEEIAQTQHNPRWPGDPLSA